MIGLPFGGTFNENALVAHIRASGRNYVIQGQQTSTYANHTKPQSLDYWLRQFGTNRDTKQADNAIVAALVATGLFQVVGRLRCPDSGARCKALRLA
jgi:curli biogenesis system outer membrane secretion channel CsgG